jgi:hypothetical protein
MRQGGAGHTQQTNTKSCPLWSAKTLSRAGQREGIFVMQPAKDGFGSDGIRLSAAIVRIWNRVHEGTDGRIGNTGTQRHVRAPGVVMGSPRFQNGS